MIEKKLHYRAVYDYVFLRESELGITQKKNRWTNLNRLPSPAGFENG